MASRDNNSEKRASISSEFTQLFLRKLQESLDRRNQNACTIAYIKTLEPVYAYEVSCMMHTLGDVAQPLPRSVEYLEAILRDQMNMLLIEASDVPSDSNALSHEQLLTLLVNNREKMTRLLHYLFLKDSSELLGKKKYDLFFESNFVGRWNQEIQNCSHRIQIETPKWSMERFNQDAVSSSQFGVRVKTCLEFLSNIGVGDYDPETITTGSDEVALERIARRFQMSSKMTDDQYLDFSKKQCICFYPKGDGGKFRAWVLADKVTLLRPTPLALDILSFFARETVAEVVEASLLVERPRPKTSVKSLPSSPLKNNSQSRTDPSEVPTELDFNITSSVSGVLGLTNVSLDASGSTSNIGSLVNTGSLGEADYFALSSTSLDEKGVVSPTQESPQSKKRKKDPMDSDPESNLEAPVMRENRDVRKSTCVSNLPEPKIPARDPDDPITVEELKTALTNSIILSPGKLHRREKKKILCL